ncbi:NUDIX domain-containing protein [Chitinophaga sp. YIM B06452]|uniref:NUDIX domain-containing protein n=1 Tax=Chitinophaga sp. YIM B06452 TaxID=3082158 RepID=UPI0031FF4581
MKKSAGILLYRVKNNLPEVMLVHPGGPFWKNKDAGAWTIPKGEFAGDEEPLDAALRELQEETGLPVKKGACIPLAPVTQKGGKLILAWAMKGDLDATAISSNTFELEWPPRSGKKQMFPEVDKAAWFTLPEAREKINPAQVALLDELAGNPDI